MHCCSSILDNGRDSSLGDSRMSEEIEYCKSCKNTLTGQHEIMYVDGVVQGDRWVCLGCGAEYDNK